jgi:LmbE family N-acetylglucosaminyl deacetylase
MGALVREEKREVSLLKILAVGAHLDDIEIACGGTLAKAVESGHEVKVLIMSKSGYTNKEGQLQRSDEVAVREGLNALHTLGIQDIEILDFETKDIPFRSDVVNAIDLRVSGYDPDMIFTHHPFDTHQAHEGVSKATIAAARRKNTVFFYEPITPSGRSYVAFKPTLYVDIESTLDKKIESLKCHTSEYNKFGAEDWIEGVRCRCGFRGYEIGRKFAEAFEILRLEMTFGEGTKL